MIYAIVFINSMIKFINILIFSHFFILKSYIYQFYGSNKFFDNNRFSFDYYVLSTFLYYYLVAIISLFYCKTHCLLSAHIFLGWRPSNSSAIFWKALVFVYLFCLLKEQPINIYVKCQKKKKKKMFESFH